MTSSAGAMRPHEIDTRVVPVPSPTVYAVEVDGEAVLLDEARERLHVLNATATIVWASFDGRSSLTDIATELGSELGVDPEAVLADSLAFARQAGAEGLLANVVPAPDRRPEVVLMREPDPGCDDDSEESASPVAAVPTDPRFVPEPPSP